jgi:tight adherence protein B
VHCGRTVSAVPSWLAALAPGLRARARWRNVLPDTPVAGPPRRWLAFLRRRVSSVGLGPRLAVATLVAGGSGLAVDGPVAAAVLAGYSATAVWLVRRAQTHRSRLRSRRFAVDAVAALASELRAGLPVSVALAASAPALRGDTAGPGAAGVARRVSEAIDVAQTSGAPLADVLDRLDTHLRTLDRANAAASAQAAGARASAVLLAVLPVAGVGVGYLISADPLDVLLHTGFGAACLGVASVLQFAGLAWSVRLSRVELPV